ncbi:MTH938/NDUFAF3 family protein [Aquidulcibacter sp.]|jgi:uncharacterized protein|uniref:Mth938-like domain-containing protein n=1 Tax=Aquidulcibacter sp. TaxID=2052990 RepID=UPI0028AB3BFF|nr:MTH938/NDUFAF3 family protein [Aquidulcibacter sp.]
MQLVAATGKGRPLITAYGAGGFRFGLETGDKRIEGSVLILADTPSAWGPLTMVDLAGASLAEHFAPILALKGKIEFVLFGTGTGILPPPVGLRDILKGAEIGLEIMPTPAACRTYNHLATEGRHFAVAMIPVT